MIFEFELTDAQVAAIEKLGFHVDWETLEYLPDDCRYWYVNAILGDDIEAV